MTFLKRTVPLAIAFILGVGFFLQFFIPHPWSGKALLWVGVWVNVIAGFSMVLGLGSLLAIHIGKLRKGAAGWGYSAVLLACLAWTVVAGFWPMHDPDTGALTVASNLMDSHYNWIYDNVFRPCGATMFSILGFYIASAAFRAFRARSLEASLLLVSAAIIMIGNIPFGFTWGKFLAGHLSHVNWLADFLKRETLFPDIKDWVLDVPTMAAKRAITFGVVLGGIATSLRIIFGIERSYLGGGKD